MTDRLPRPPQADLITSLELINGCVFQGFIVDPNDLSRRFTIELLIDGIVVGTAYAENFHRALALQKVGDGCYGFVISVAPVALDNAVMAEARIANMGTPVGSRLALRDLDPGAKTPAARDLRWRGGLRFSGWIVDHDETAPKLNVVVDGELTLEIVASGWAHADDDTHAAQPVRAFDFHLPEHFADGCVRWVRLRKPSGEWLTEPQPFVAFFDGLATALGGLAVLDSERLRGELYDRLIPMSLPISSYEQWHSRFANIRNTNSLSNCAVVLIGPGSVEASLASLEGQTLPNWTAITVDPESDPMAFDASVIYRFLEDTARQSHVVVFAVSGMILAPDALDRFTQAFYDHDNAVAAYADLSIEGVDGGVWPVGFPTFDYERMLEQGYCAYLFALRRDVVEICLTRAPSNLYRLFNSLLDDKTIASDAIVHLPGCLGTLPKFDMAAASLSLREATAAHLQHRGVAASLHDTLNTSNFFSNVRVTRALPPGRTTIVIPTRNRVDLLRDCLRSIEPAVSQSDANILIVDNDSTDPETIQFLAQIAQTPGISVLRIDGPFNYARLNNLAVQSVDTEFLCLLNNDIKALDPNWLSEMLSRLEPDVGAVGALLIWPTGMVQHGGVVLGPAFSAAHAFNDRTADDPGYADMLCVARECSAVTAACLLTRRADYLNVGGMDEVRLPISFNDTDYCLKQRERSKRIVFTPHAKLIHLESASRGNGQRHGAAARFQREVETLRARWGQLIVDDPYYNPMLSLDQVPYSALAWPPRDMSARTTRRAIQRDIPSGF